MNLEANGLVWNVDVTGSGEPFVLLHGFTGNLQTWDRFVPEWSRWFRVVRLDLIGHGDTSKPSDPRRYTMDLAVSDLATLFDQLGIQSAHVLGYSMGGRLALSFAMRYPECVQTLILESSSPGLRTEAERRDRIQQDESLARMILEKGIRHFVDQWEQLPLFQSQQRLPEPVRQAIRAQRLQNDPVGLANSLRGMGTGMQPSWWDHLPQFFVPTLLIAGRLDTKFCRIAHEMKQMLPNAVRVVIPEAGHTPHVEQPGIFGTIVTDYVRSSKRRHTYGG
jgi:2-succinyl-6-hydroxy-2,4-cyclohexadiene-1-carboxylate synthase